MEIPLTVVVIQVNVGQPVTGKRQHVGWVLIAHLGVPDVEEQVEIGMIYVFYELKRGLYRGQHRTRKVLEGYLESFALSQLG